MVLDIFLSTAVFFCSLLNRSWCKIIMVRLKSWNHHIEIGLDNIVVFFFFCILLLFCGFPASNYVFQVNNRNNKTKCEICSELIIETPEWQQRFLKSHRKTPVLEALFNKVVGHFKVIGVFLVSLLLTHVCFCIFIVVLTLNM